VRRVARALHGVRRHGLDAVRLRGAHAEHTVEAARQETQRRSGHNCLHIHEAEGQRETTDQSRCKRRSSAANREEAPYAP
jgi:hypothetical protein